jgi:PhnB protein
MRLPAPGGKIGHAEMEIGDSRITPADEAPTHDAKAPGAFGGSPVNLHLYVSDADTTIAKAAAAGATIKAQPEDKFYGDRSGTLLDPFGHTWNISTHIEDVTVEEIERRMGVNQL